MRIPPMASENTLERHAHVFSSRKGKKKNKRRSLLRSRILWKKIFQSTEKNGVFIFDVFLPNTSPRDSRSAILSARIGSGARHRNSPPFVFSTKHRIFPIDRSLYSYLSHFLFRFVPSPLHYPCSRKSNREWRRLVQIPRIPFESPLLSFRGI